jgi:hypothetical protein
MLSSICPLLMCGGFYSRFSSQLSSSSLLFGRLTELAPQFV